MKLQSSILAFRPAPFTYARLPLSPTDLHRHTPFIKTYPNLCRGAEYLTRLNIKEAFRFEFLC